MKNLEIWARENKDKLEKLGIKTENIFLNKYSCFVDHSTEKCIGRVTINSEGHVDIEILEIESGIRLMLANYLFQNHFHEDLIIPYIRILSSSVIDKD